MSLLKKISSIFLVLIFFGVSAASAATVYLKNGKVIQGKIVQEETNYIKIQVKGIPFMYFNDEIERIEREKDRPKDVAALEVRRLRSAADIPKEKAQLVRDLLEANGAQNNIKNVFNQVLEDVPLEQRSLYFDLFKVDEVIEVLIPLYDKYYSDEELKNLIRFYNSDVGKKAVAVTPGLMQGTMNVTIEYFQKKLAVLQANQ